MKPSWVSQPTAHDFHSTTCSNTSIISSITISFARREMGDTSPKPTVDNVVVEKYSLSKKPCSDGLDQSDVLVPQWYKAAKANTVPISRRACSD